MCLPALGQACHGGTIQLLGAWLLYLRFLEVPPSSLAQLLGPATTERPAEYARLGRAERLGLPHKSLFGAPNA